MPDDFNLFDDDDLTPGDVEDEGDGSSANDSDNAQANGDARPAWSILPGDAPPSPAAQDAEPPWAAHPGETPPPPAIPPIPAPWDAPEDAPANEPADLDWLLAEDAPGTGEDVAAPGEGRLMDQDDAEAGAEAEPADLGWLFEDEPDADAALATPSPAGEPAPGPDEAPLDLEADLFDEAEPAEGTAPLDWLLEDDDLAAETDAASEPPDETEAEPEALPDWLLAGYASEEEARAAEESAAETDEETDSVPEWLKPAAESVARGDDLTFDFDDDERKPAGTGELPDWLAAQAAASGDAPAGDDPAPDDNDAGDEEALPDWLAAEVAEDATPEEPDAREDEEPSVEDDALPEWLGQAASEPEDEIEPETPSSGIRRILDDDARVPVWVYNPDVEPPDDIPDDMTYEEWEAYHEAREQALQQQPEPAPRSPEAPAAPDVPGMPEPPLPDLPEMDQAARDTAAAPEDDANIPDWVRDIDFDADPLTQPFTSAAPDPTDAGTPGELPDWMTGADDSDTDWAALFGAPPAGEADEAGDAAIRRLDARGEGELPGVDADWLDEEPESEAADMSWLFEDDAAGMDAEPPAAHDMPGAAEPAAEPASDIPDWLADAQPETDAGAAPGDAASEAPDLEALFADMNASGDEEGDAMEWPPQDGEDEADFLPEDEDADLPELEDVFPDLDDRGADVPPPEAEPHIPGWLAEIERQERVEGPEEIPFPELALDAPDAPQPEPEPAASEDDALSGDFVERFDPLEPTDFDAEEAPPERDTEPEAPMMPGAGDMPDWLHNAGMPEPGADDIAWPEEPPLPEDLAPAGDTEAAAALDADEPDWLQEISPEDVAAEDAIFPPEAAESAPAQEAQTTAEEDDAALQAAPLDSSALDDLLGTAPVPVDATAQESDDIDALFSELPDDLDAAETAFESDDMWPGTEDLAAAPSEPSPEGAPPGETDIPPAGEDASAAPPAEEPPKRRGIFGLFGRRHKEKTPAPADADTGTETPEPEPLLVAEPQPDWVEDLRPSELPVKVQAGGAERDVKQKKVAELPARLRAFRERAMSGVEAPEAPEPPGEGPLAGVAGALPLSDAILPGDITRETVGGLVVTPEQQKRADHLQHLLDTVAEEEEERGVEPDIFTGPSLGLLEPTDMDEAREEAPAPEPQPERRRARRKPDRWLVALVLLAALIGPFVSEALHIADDPPALTGHRREFAAAIDASVSEGDYVLVAFEYSPSAAGEMDALADALLRDVLARGAIPLTLSTNPAGALHAETVLGMLASDAALLDARDQDEAALAWGEDYLALGYLPGDVVGVRALRAAGDYNYQARTIFEYDLRGERTDLPVMTLDGDIALVAVIGDESGDVRTWAEQLDGVNVPKVALVAAAIEPLTTPYVHASGFAGYLAGARDAYSYNAARNADARTPYTMPGDAPDIPSPETSRWQSMALGVLAAIALISVGLFVNLLRGLLRRRHR